MTFRIQVHVIYQQEIPYSTDTEIRSVSNWNDLGSKTDDTLDVLSSHHTNRPQASNINAPAGHQNYILSLLNWRLIAHL